MLEEVLRSSETVGARYRCRRNLDTVESMEDDEDDEAL